MTLRQLRSLLLALTRRSDITLALLLVAVIFMMILPIPTVLVDTLIAINIGGAVVLLMVAVYIPTPLSFSAFPSVLLLSTLFRLALSITTTRLILLQADAGAIVYTFGDFVVAGNLVVGLVVFLIITLVQFIVITKGSERVAEVSARFSLDAMPGKQMSIDSDLRAGVITVDQARFRRNRLEKESQLYGAMDGAMKFVKGDAIAGLCIIVVNILGGISVGVLQQNMSVGEALQLYAILTVGDGLVAQIPALFVAITAGIIVTRVTAEESINLGADIGAQILAQPNALLIGAALMLGFAFIPGFPMLIFLLLGLGMGSVGFTLKALAKPGVDSSLESLPATAAAGQQPLIRPLDLFDEEVAAAPLLVEIAETARDGLMPEFFNDELLRVRRALNRDLGVPFPGVDIRFSDALDEDRYVIYLQEIPVGRGRLGLERMLIAQGSEQLQLLKIPYQEEPSFIANLPALWVDVEHAETLYEHGIEPLAATQIVCLHLAGILRRYADQFVGIQETHYLLSQLEPRHAELVKEAQRVVPLPKIADVLQRLVAEDISIRDLRSILEALVKWGQREKEPELLSEYVRSSLKRQISYRFSAGGNILPVYLIDPATEETLRNSVHQTPTGSYLALEPNASRNLLDKLRSSLGVPAGQTRRPALLTTLDIRRHLRQLIQVDFQDVPVLSYQELTPDITVQPLGQIKLAA
ncbi:MAG: type III secretion system export apparatus subunit SctV [Candidatus Competibacteraceae bacterium]|nr:type III secretion system export apparatus subunit SctV [Candidatus Competibacteraceae bacterium]